MKVTFLGPTGTFSQMAYERMARQFEGPLNPKNYRLVGRNEEVLLTLVKHRRYGAVAMETLKDRRITAVLDTFLDLLKKHDTESCPIIIPGALSMQINFALMAHPEIVEMAQTQNVQRRILGHEKAYGPCQGFIKRNKAEFRAVSSNAEGARLVAQDPNYKPWAALGPAIAAKEYGLKIIEPACEDSIAITTFFFLAPRRHSVFTGEKNRMLIAFEIPHKEGALVTALESFRTHKLNLIHIHNRHKGEGLYDFVIEVDVPKDKLQAAQKATAQFRKKTTKHLIFGPFQVLS